MKRILSLIAALALSAGLTACANTAADTDMTPRYDDYGTYQYDDYGYDGRVGTPNGGNSYNGNVSTSPNGRVNGSNRTNGATGTGRTNGTTSTNRTTTGTTRPNTNSMGAGMRG